MITIGLIQAVVAERYDVSVAEICSDRRHAGIIWPRHVAMLLSRRLTPCSLPVIGRRFGRDHTTILAAVRDVEATEAADPVVRAELARLEELLRTAAATLDGLGARLKPEIDAFELAQQVLHSDRAAVGISVQGVRALAAAVVASRPAPEPDDQEPAVSAAA